MQWKGTIAHSGLDIIQVILLNTLQHLISQILQTGWPVILDVVVCRHANIPLKL